MRTLRRTGLALLLLAATLPAQQDTRDEARAEQIIQQLDMRPLARESGYWGVIGATAPIKDIQGRALASQSATYSLLTRTKPTRFLNRMVPIETDVLVEGGPVDVYTFCGAAKPDLIVVGRDYGQLEQPLAILPSNCWKAERLHDGATYALMINLLSPEFTTDRVTTGAGPDWIRNNTGRAPWATPDFLRSLIGPNYQP